MTAPLIPLSFNEAFRIWAWQSCYLSEDRFYKLGPLYYCPTCILPQKDLAKGCPTCPLSELVIKYKAAAAFEIKERGGFAEGVTLDKVIDIYATVSSILADNDNKINQAWELPFAALARIILEERNQYQFEANYKERQRIKSITAK
jgi:hypothetical protein